MPFFEGGSTLILSAYLGGVEMLAWFIVGITSVIAVVTLFGVAIYWRVEDLAKAVKELAEVAEKLLSKNCDLYEIGTESNPKAINLALLESVELAEDSSKGKGEYIVFVMASGRKISVPRNGRSFEGVLNSIALEKGRLR